MNLYYSPFFNGNCFADYKANPMNDGKIVNDLGLLEELELRLGLSCKPTHETDRVKAYTEALKRHKNGAFYEESFYQNEQSVAVMILRWRDQLVMAGWKPDRNAEQFRLKTLAAIESCSNLKNMLGVPERWNRVLSLLNGGSKLANLKVEVHCHKLLIAPLILEVINKLGASFLVAVYNQSFTISNSSLEIVPVLWQQQVYDQIATKVWDNTTMVVGDELMTSAAMQSADLPMANASATANHSRQLQLFRQLFYLCSGPVNLLTLRDLLEQKHSPIPSALAANLRYALCRESGFGEEWSQQKNKYVTTANKFDASESEEDRKKKLRLIELIESINRDEVKTSKVVELATAVENWANKQNFNDRLDRAAKADISLVKAMCKQLKACLAGASENLTDSDLKDFVNEIYGTTTETYSNAELGSVRVVADVRNCLTTPKHLWWLNSGDCSFVYPYDFLLETERTALNLPSKEELTQANHDMYVTYLNKAEKITLYVAQQNESGNMSMNPIVSELLYSLNRAADVASSVYAKFSVNEAPVKTYSPKNYYEIGKVDLPNLSNSPSVFEKVLQSPFDYFAEKVVGLKVTDASDMVKVSITYGNVAHRVVELLVKENPNNLASLRADFAANYRAYFNQAIREKGIIFLERRNRLLLVNFEKQLKESLTLLFDALEKMGFAPVCCEEPVNETDFARSDSFSGFGNMKGSIDMVIKNSNDEYAIIDFKWSEDDEKYRGYLNHNTSVQLEMYRQLLSVNKDWKVIFVAYYLFPLNELYIYENFVTKQIAEGTCIKRLKYVPTVSDLWQCLQNSYTQRLDELTKGKIEDGAGLPVNLLDYQKKDGLYPLTVRKDTARNEIKDFTYSYKTLKDQLS